MIESGFAPQNDQIIMLGRGRETQRDGERGGWRERGRERHGERERETKRWRDGQRGREGREKKIRKEEGGKDEKETYEIM